MVIQNGEFQFVEKAIEEAERKTSAEIVPMIVRSSSARGHVGIIVACLIFCLVSISLHTYLGIAIGAVLALVIGFISARSNLLLRWFTFDEDLRQQVLWRAESEFYRNNLHSTQGRTGLLIFVSLAEHQAVILSDKTIAEKIPNSAWEETITSLLKNIRSRTMGESLADAVRSCGVILQKDFPIASGDTNELRNHLIVKD